MKSFLESADMVKFAAVIPDKKDVETSFNTAKEFVGLVREPQLAEAEAR